MSDYIYGSSLKAAKSKANYLFEGDFRRRPAQNLSGASRSLTGLELLQQAALQRQNREDTRRREIAALTIQSQWRGHRVREQLASSMRQKFDSIIAESKFDINIFETLCRGLITSFRRRQDEDRFKLLVDLMMKYPDVVLESKRKNSLIWSFRLGKLLMINLIFLRQNPTVNLDKYLQFMDYYTRDEDWAIWKLLIDNKLYPVMHMLTELDGIDSRQKHILEILRRSLDVKLDNSNSSVVYKFYEEYLKEPVSPLVERNFERLLDLSPHLLKPKLLLEAFVNPAQRSAKKLAQQFGLCSFAATTTMDYCRSATWTAYMFLKALSREVGTFSEQDKIEYIRTLSHLLAPIVYLTNMLTVEANNKHSQQQFDDDDDESIPDSSATRPHADTHELIGKIIAEINKSDHISQLRSVIFNASDQIQSQIQEAIVLICNLMLTHEDLAIFNCRLLYTIAFSKDFSRSLWNSIVTASDTTIYGTSILIHRQIIRGNNMNQGVLQSILSKLRLFCCLCSYLLPTLGDDEFYTNRQELNDQHSQVKPSGGISGFYVDRELIGISATLRDICVGLIEIIYQGNNGCSSNGVCSTGLQLNISPDTQLVLKSCFQALVRLVRQLHARDSRKKFCPDDHWICPSVVIPANKAIDFQLSSSSQQGQQVSPATGSSSSAMQISSELKTVLILQEIPFVISFHDRVQIFHQLLKRERQIHNPDGYHFGLPGHAISVKIRRNYIYEDAFEELSPEQEVDMKMPLKVALINLVGAEEAGVDGGGLTKEFLSELLKTGFDPMRGFFKYTKDNFLYPNPSAKLLFAHNTNIHYEFLGRMLGKAIFEKIMVELPLAGFFLAKLLADKHTSDVDLHNLESLDPVLYKNLIYLKNYQNNAADLNLDFTISNNDLGEHEIIQLKPNGSQLPVTNDNKIEYVHLVADYRLNKQIRSQCSAFKRGLAQLIELDWLRMFDPRELQILISGANIVIDVADWRRHTIYGTGYTDASEAVKTFWSVVEQFDESNKRKLLKFATSCSLPPLLGFKELVPQFAIAPSEEARLPTASTCMNLLKLPECENQEAMRSKLLYAIESNAGFELS